MQVCLEDHGLGRLSHPPSTEPAEPETGKHQLAVWRRDPDQEDLLCSSPWHLEATSQERGYDISWEGCHKRRQWYLMLSPHNKQQGAISIKLIIWCRIGPFLHVNPIDKSICGHANGDMKFLDLLITRFSGWVLSKLSTINLWLTLSSSTSLRGAAGYQREYHTVAALKERRLKCHT